MPTTYAIPQGNKYMDATTYTGTGTTNVITNGGFQPDLIWNKARNAANAHLLTDSVRGVTKEVGSNRTDAEQTVSNAVVSFNSNGVTLGNASFAVLYGSLNDSGTTYVGWQWKGGGAAVTNNDGNRTSQVSANTTSGFSVVTYTFSTSGTNTIGHGLGVAPAFILMKDRTTAYNWDVYHQSVGYTNRLVLNSTAAAASGFWASTPTSTTFAVTSSMGNNNDEIVAYCWAQVAGFSQFGSYTGNGSSDGPFVYTGFRPKFLMTKTTSTTSNWDMWDSSRNLYNVETQQLYANLNSTEGTGSGDVDFLSNGFKIRSSNADFNSSSQTIIYAAFAENPFKYANAR